MTSTGSPRDPLHARLLGGRYRVERELARGGMASVHVAVDERLGRRVAIKMLSEPYASQPRFVDRFLAEARTAAGFSHPNLAHVYDSGSDGDRHFIAMELLDEHHSLRDLLRSRGRLEPNEAIEVAKAVLAGLAELHAAGLVHCDVKPANVMIGAGEIKLIDFGIARRMHAGPEAATSIGSLHTMAPEQLRGEPMTAATDLFAVGVVLYQALTGNMPFPGADASEVAAAQGGGRPPPPSSLAGGIDPRVDLVVLQALELAPERRFASAPAMEAALHAAAAGAADVAERPAAGDDTTVIVPVATRTDERQPAPPQLAPVVEPRQEGVRVSERGAPRRGPGAIGWLTLLAVPVLIAMPVLLNQPGGGGSPAGPGSSPTPVTATPPAQATPTPNADTVQVPNTIGMSEEEAQAAAQELGLNWRIEWRVDASKAPGIYAQDPPPGTPVAHGSRFVMQAYRAG